MDPQQFEEGQPSSSQQQEPDQHDEFDNHSDDYAESIKENSIQQTKTRFDKDLDLNTEGNYN